MEIKVVNNTETYIFEGEDIKHETVSYCGKKEYYDSMLDEGLRGDHVLCEKPIGIFSHERIKNIIDFEETPGSFLIIKFKEGDNLKCILVQNSIVYITNKGYTIDKIEI